MRKTLIKMLYASLDNWAKWELYGELKRPSMDEVLLEQAKQAERIFGK